MIIRTPKQLFVPLIAVALVGCSGAPKKVESLEAARAAYEAASSDEAVARFAPKELDAAKLAIVRADRVWQDDGSRELVEHEAYLAAHRIEIAELIAAKKQADQQLIDMKHERKSVQLDLRADEIERARLETETARDELQEMQRQLAELKAQETERGMVLTLGDVLFDVDKATLKPGADIDMDKIANFLQQYPERVAIIEGHTDNMGEDEYNMDLSRERAFAVKSALMARGVEASRISTQGFGEARPVASNNDYHGRKRNRRVEIIFPDENTKVSALAR